MYVSVEVVRMSRFGVVWGKSTAWPTILRIELMEAQRLCYCPTIVDEGLNMCSTTRVLDVLDSGLKLDSKERQGSVRGSQNRRRPQHRAIQAENRSFVQVAKQQGEYLAKLLRDGNVRPGEPMPQGTKPFRCAVPSTLVFHPFILRSLWQG